jgi:formylglycine-generating enzyme required for sulfatase activity
LLVLLLVGIGLVFPMTSRTGTVVLNLTEPDVELLIDGEARSAEIAAGVARLELPTGEHTLTVTRDKEELYRTSFRVKPGVEVMLDATWPPLAKAPFNAQQARDHQEAWAKYLGLPVVFTNKLDMKFRLIPPGEFTMGTPGADEEAWTRIPPYAGTPKLAGPPHLVRLTRPFYIGEREVRYRDFRDLMKHDGSVRPAHPHNEPDGALLHNCTWFDCVEFCNLLSEREGLTPAYEIAGQTVTVTRGATGYRLPTEAEWEYACRAGTTTLWHFGWTASEALAMANRNLTEAETYLRNRLAVPNAFGLFDLYAGASEWCWDWHTPAYYTDCAALGVVVDPWGPEAGEARVTRGGRSYAHAGGFLSLNNTATRVPDHPTRVNSPTGFGRVVLPISTRGQLGATGLAPRSGAR